MLVEIDDRAIANARRGADELRMLLRSVSTEAKVITVDTASGRVTLELDVLRSVAEVVESVHAHHDIDPEEEVTPREAAKILRMSRPSLMRLVGKGHLTARKVGAHHRLSRAEVVAYKLAQSGVRRGSLAAIASITEEFDF